MSERPQADSYGAEMRRLNARLDTMTKLVNRVDTARRNRSALIDTRVVAGRLKRARSDVNLSQAAVSSFLGLSEGVIGQWEQGLKRPSLARIFQLATIYGVSMGWLCGHPNEAKERGDG